MKLKQFLEARENQDDLVDELEKYVKAKTPMFRDLAKKLAHDAIERHETTFNSKVQVDNEDHASDVFSDLRAEFFDEAIKRFLKLKGYSDRRIKKWTKNRSEWMDDFFHTSYAEDLLDDMIDKASSERKKELGWKDTQNKL